MLLSIIICTYKRPVLLSNCLVCAIEVLNTIDSEVIVINDYKSEHAVVPNHPKIKLYNNPKQGLASARNLGAKMAKGELLLFVDDDIEFSLNNVRQILNLYNTNPGGCINPNWKYPKDLLAILTKTQFGRFLIKYKLINYQGWVPELNWQNEVFEVKKLAGFFMLVPKSIFDDVDGFNEEFLHQGTEDDELCLRLQRKNIKMFIDPANYVLHNELDRISLEMRLARYYNGAVNRRKAFDLGHLDYKIKYNLIKRLVYSSLWPIRKVIINFLKILPNKLYFDLIYFKVTHLLLGVFIFGGYHSKKLS